MGAASENKFPKLILEERLSDGSDTSNPAADHRALFLGEDGALRLRDSAGGISSVASGSAIAAWEMKKDTASTQTMTNATDTLVTFEGAGVDSGGGVIDLANDRFVAPATGLFVAYCAPQWTGGTLPTNALYVTPKVGGADVTSRIIKGVAPTSAGGVEGFRLLSLTSGDFVTMYFNPGAVTGCTLRGSTSVQLQTRFMLVRLT
jgi:hypothetical protein